MTKKKAPDNGHGGVRPGAGRKPLTPEEQEAKRVRRAKAARDRRTAAKAESGETARPTVPAEAKTAAAGAGAWGDPKALMALSSMFAAKREAKARRSPFLQLMMPPPGVLPKGAKKLAMDQAVSWADSQWGALGPLFNSVASQGLQFLGYPFLAELTQRTEYRQISETIADDATRKWVDFEVTGEKEREEKDDAERDRQSAERNAGGVQKPPAQQGQDLSPEPWMPDDEKGQKAENPDGNPALRGRGFTDADPEKRQDKIKAAGKMEKVKAIKDELARLELRDRMYCICRDDGFYGRTHLMLKFGKSDKQAEVDDELKKDIGDGRDALSKGKVGKDNPLRAVKTIEPVWTYPTFYNATDPSADDWYAPQVWYVMGRQFHVSRLLPFIGHPVSDLLKPAYAFGGISLSQLAMPSVDIWLRTRDSVGELIHAFSVMCLGTDVQTILAPGASGGPGALMARADAFNAFRDNMGLFIFNKNTEDFKNVSAPLGGLHELVSQTQEHIMSSVRIPDIKYTGINPSGLNASTDGTMRAYYDTISGYQNRFERPNLTKVINFVQLSLFGEIDPEITFEFEPLWEMSEKEKADLQKAQGERDQIYVNLGALAPEEVRKNIIDDPTLPYSDLDPDDVPELRTEEEQGLIPPGAGKAEEAVLGDPNGQQPAGGGPGGAGGGGGAGPASEGPKPGHGDPAFQEDEALDDAPPRGLPWADRYEWMRGFDIPAADASGNQIAPTARGEAARKGLRIGSRVRYASGTGRAVGFVNDADNERVAILDADNDRFICAPVGTVSTRPVAAADVARNTTAQDWRRGGGDASVLPFSGDAADLDPLFAGLAGDAFEWEESKHPRDPKGEFTAGASAGAASHAAQTGSSAPKAKGYGWHGGPSQHLIMPQFGLSGPPGEGHKPEPRPPLDPSKLKKVGPQMGSNPGGVFEDDKGRKFYVKQGRSKAHVRNEFIAADLYALAGAPTLFYRDVAGGDHIASEMEKLSKKNAGELSPDEVKRAKRDFLAHAWTSNYDAVGTGGDNLVAAGHDVFSVDLGGALEYRARGAPKGDAFGNQVTEIDTMRDPKMAPDASKVFGDITPSEFKESAAKVTRISDDAIRDAVEKRGGTEALADKMIARRDDVAKRARTFGAEGKPEKKTSTVIFPAGDALPVKALNGVPFKAWEPPKDGDWNEVDGQIDIEGEEALPASAHGKQLASGVVIREKDGRVWLVQPKGGFGGYSSTFPKGRVEPSLSLQANAIKEAWEESGLKARITGLAGDRDGDVTFTRYYLAEREGGDPSQTGDETEGVVLAPPDKLAGFLNRERDQKLAKEVVGDEYAAIIPAGEAVMDEEPGAPRTLYVNRPLLNAGDLVKWANENGIKKTLPPEDVHVTVAFSKEPVEWADAADKEGKVKVIVPGGERSIERLGDKGAVVLRFGAPHLERRWEQLRDIGASWDWPSYKPHVTITYDIGDVDIDKIEPYAGPLEFGPERFAEVDLDWADKVKAALVGDAGWEEGKHPRGQPENKGQFGSGGGGGGQAKRTSAGRPTPRGGSGAVLRSQSQGAAQAAAAAPKHDSGKLLEKSVADALAKATPEQKKAAAEHDKRTKEFFASEPARKAMAKAVGDFAKKHAAAMANYHLTDAIMLPGVHHVVEQAVSAIGFGSVPGLTLGATAVAAYAASQLIERYHLNLSGAKELLAPVVRGMIDVLGNVKETSARIADLEKRGLIGAEDAARDPSVLDSLILLLMEVEKLGEEEQAHDEAPFEESKHPRDAKGEFAAKGNEGSGGGEGEEKAAAGEGIKQVSTADIVKKANENANEQHDGKGLDDLSPLQVAQHKYKAAMQLGSNYASATWATTTEEDDALKQVYGSTENAWKALAEKAKNEVPAGGEGAYANFKAEIAKINNAQGEYADLDTSLKSAEAKVKAGMAWGEAPDDLVGSMTNAEYEAIQAKYGNITGAYADIGGSAEINEKIDALVGLYAEQLNALKDKDTDRATALAAKIDEFDQSLKDEAWKIHEANHDAQGNPINAAAVAAPAQADKKTKFGGLWKTTGLGEKADIQLNANTVLLKPTNAGQSYRQMMTFLINNAAAGDLDADIVGKLKIKLVEALYKAGDKATQLGKTDDAKKINLALNKIGMNDSAILAAGMEAYEASKSGKPAPVYKPTTPKPSVTAQIAAQALKENPKMAAIVAAAPPSFNKMSDIEKFVPEFAAKIKKLNETYKVSSKSSAKMKVKAAVEGGSATLEALNVALKPAEKKKLETMYGSVAAAYEEWNNIYGPNSPQGKFAAEQAQKQMPIAADPEKPTDPEIAKAKKTAPLQLKYVPNAPAGSAEAQKLVDQFNEKWSGKEVSDADALEKIADFKAMAEKMKPLMSEAQKKAAEQNAKLAEEAKKSQAEQAAKAAAEAEKHKTELAEYKKEFGISNVEAQGFEGLLSLLGKSKSELINEFKKSDVQAGHGITKFEGALIAAYKGSSSIVNKEMRKPEASWSVPQVMFAKVLNKALGKLPGFKGETIRNAPLTADVQMRYKPGQIVFEHGFTGTSKVKPNGVFTGSNTRFYVTGIGKRGGDIADMHGFEGEQEVLYQAHTMFHVDKVEGQVGGSGNASYKVWMTEVEM